MDLRGGEACWKGEARGLPASTPPPRQIVDIAIVGAGVVGAMLAERLSATGLRVAVLDRRPPSWGATAASTALVMWAADTPLVQLAETIGADAAGRRWRRVRQAVLDLSMRIADLRLDCGWESRLEVYLDGDVLDEEGLVREGEARRAVGLASEFCGPAAIAERFGVEARPGLVSADTFEVDPVALTQGMLRAALARGATITYPADVVASSEDADGVQLTLASGEIVRARQVILACGYEAPRPFLPAAFELGSSFAIATGKATAPLWRDDAMIWEAADPYLYCRATRDGRVIIGGADEDFVDAARRDAMIPDKRRQLEQMASRLLKGAKIDAEYAWSATFGTSPDGLPAIGKAKDHDRLWLACGFGGNGVTFASLAAEIIASALDGRPDPDAICFSPYRFETDNAVQPISAHRRR
ncbi:MAG: FAD-dependent oxidoreductase [Phenylobacterium sp.]|nr:FAD-dependent oxidoreductase [Phenylobacterium sp.]